MLSELAVLALSALLVARDDAQEAHDETLEWRELESFSASLRVRLVYFKHMETKTDPNGSGLMVYRITQKGIDALKEQKAELERPPAKRGRRPKAAAAPADLTPSEKIRAKIQRLATSTNGKGLGGEIHVQEVARSEPEWTPPAPVVYTAAPADYVPPTHTPVNHSEMLPELSLNHNDDCADCVYREAVDILAARLPGVGELVEALKTVRSLRK